MIILKKVKGYINKWPEAKRAKWWGMAMAEKRGTKTLTCTIKSKENKSHHMHGWIDELDEEDDLEERA